MKECLRCAEDPLYFITTYCRTSDREGNVSEIPLWPHVRSFIEALHQGDDMHIEKSRQMMATWLVCAYFLWAVMYKPGFAGFMTSRKEKLVDDGGDRSTHESLLGRVRFIYNRLDPWVKRKVVFAHLRVTCETNGAVIVGESANPDIARGGTYTMALLDEWAKVAQSEQAYKALCSACERGKIMLSTPNGPNNNFARIKKLKSVRIRYHRMHWTEHPLRTQDLTIDPATGKHTSSWYREQTETMTATHIAQELDINYESSVAGQVYPQFSYEIHMRNDVKYDDNLPLRLAIDFGIGAKTAAIIFQKYGREFRGLVDYELENEIAPNHAANLWHIIQGLGFEGRPSDVYCYGDPAGNARDLTTGSTVIKEYRAFGFTTFETKRSQVLDGIRAVRTMLQRQQMFFSMDCENVPERMVGYHFPTDDLDRVMNDKPVHDDSSHLCDAIRYAVICGWSLEDAYPSYTTPAVPQKKPRQTQPSEMPGGRSLIPQGDDDDEPRFVSSRPGRRY